MNSSPASSGSSSSWRNERQMKGHPCQECGKAFNSSHQLAQHARIHTGEKPYKCSFCDKSFKQLSHVQQHTRLHTGERPYKCPKNDCGKAFIQLSNLNQHLKVHSSSRSDFTTNLVCTFCSKIFKSESSLLTHKCRSSSAASSSSVENHGGTRGNSHSYLNQPKETRGRPPKHPKSSEVQNNNQPLDFHGLSCPRGSQCNCQYPVTEQKSKKRKKKAKEMKQEANQNQNIKQENNTHSEVTPGIILGPVMTTPLSMPTTSTSNVSFTSTSSFGSCPVCKLLLPSSMILPHIQQMGMEDKGHAFLWHQLNNQQFPPPQIIQHPLEQQHHHHHQQQQMQHQEQNQYLLNYQ